MLCCVPVHAARQRRCPRHAGLPLRCLRGQLRPCRLLRVGRLYCVRAARHPGHANHGAGPPRRLPKMPSGSAALLLRTRQAAAARGRLARCRRDHTGQLAVPSARHLRVAAQVAIVIIKRSRHQRLVTQRATANILAVVRKKTSLDVARRKHFDAEGVPYR